ncbi:MAG: type IV pilus assembly protein PilM [Thermoguttaceae bacterium]|jgi:type IV pilus assembly protein PilM
MARTGAVWGIDVGQCALKALRCRATAAADKIEADAFDYIEYPKILSQPDANPVELIDEALKQFLSRNSVGGDSVAISVSGQAGLARFIKLPPVEARKIPDIVRYEAKQQIPFDLNDVIWDYQRLGIGTEEEGYALETEIGLFAMKREAVFRALEPFQKAGIEIDFVQLTPLALYNYLLFDQLRNLPKAEEYDPENPPESTVILSLGTDATDLVITNGYKVWQRSIPLGGNHFTKALTKEMKLTFAKAEHLKRNATAAADPKAVFQAMRPVFNELLTQLQRSIGYFSNLERSAKIGRIVALGNAMKLPGLRRYLAQSLGYDIERVQSFRGLVGSQVLSSPIFKENAICYGICYGLTLQGLGKPGLHTNLLPKEIVKDRLIKRKKPWAVAAAALLLLGCGISFGAYAMAMNSVEESAWKSATKEAKDVIDASSQLKNDANTAEGGFKSTDQIGQHLVGNVEGRISWLELIRAIDQCLPPHKSQNAKPAAVAAAQKPADGSNVKISEREELHVKNLECQYSDDVSAWYTLAKQWDKAADAAAQPGGAGADTSTAPAATPSAPTGEPSGEQANVTGPKGPGWIVKLEGCHYHNDSADNSGAQYVRNTLIENLLNAKVILPTGEKDPNGKDIMDDVSMPELGITCPILVNPTKLIDEEIDNPIAGGESGGRKADEAGRTRLQRFDFNVQFCWQPKSPSERRALKEKEAAIKAQQSASGEQPRAQP